MSGPDFDTSVELVPKRLYALGGMVPLDGEVSWVPETARGFQPTNCYLLLEGRKALLVDTGLPYHEAQILEQLAHLLPADAELSIYLTRSEMDAGGNVGPIAACFGVQNVYAGGNNNPFDGFDQIISPTGEDRAVAKGQLFRRIREGSVVIDGGRSLEVVTPPFRMLTSFWGYDAQTETLFTSCIFGQHVWPDDGYRPVATLADDRSTAQSVKAFTTARYWWLDYVETGELLSRLDAIFAKYSIMRIAPSHGAVVSGPALVKRHYGFVRQMLIDATDRLKERSQWDIA